MNTIKKSLKKKKLLHSKHLKTPKTKKPIQMEEKVKIITLNHKESFHIKGNFSFIVLNGYLKMDFYELRTHQIHKFNSSTFVNVIGHQVPIKMEDYIHQYQQQQLQSEEYYDFLNFILKKFPNELSILISGTYEISDFGYMLSEEKQELFQNNYKSAMFIGEKQVGKSTSLLLYANKLLNQGQVFILDTDLGQSLNLPGFINLLQLDKPLFLAKPNVLFQGFIGELQVFNHFDLYFIKIAEALTIYNQSQLLKDHPLLINTAGFITSYGITIIQELINILQPQICILLSRKHQKRIVEKSDFLYEQLQKKSFISNQDTFKTKICLLHEYYDFEQTGQTIIEQTPQIRKNLRTQKISENLGIENLNYLTLCKATNIKQVNVKQLKFIVINEKRNYFDLEEIGHVFLMSLVAIENDGAFLGLGFIKDLDVINNIFHIITQVEFSAEKEYYVIKSKYFNIQQDSIGEITLEDIYNYLDEQCIDNGEPLEYMVHLPYIQQKSEAIGDVKHKITVNKKVY